MGDLYEAVVERILQEDRKEQKNQAFFRGSRVILGWLAVIGFFLSFVCFVGLTITGMVVEENVESNRYGFMLLSIIIGILFLIGVVTLFLKLRRE